MRTTLVVFGSRGDIQPHMAFALALQEAGHTVTYATHRAFEGFVNDFGVPFAPLAGDPLDAEQVLISTPAPDSVTYMNRMLRYYRSIRDQFERDVRAACRGADAILHNNMAPLGAEVAREQGVPSALSVMQPLDYPFAWGPLRRLQRDRYPVLYGFSELLYPRPADWGPWVHMTGYWFQGPPPGWEPPAGLVAFLEEGPPPVAIGFGSVPEGSPGSLTLLALDALRRSGRRGVLLSGIGALGGVDLPPWAYLIDEIPYDWLFPRTAAVVYHGGLGTTLEALRAGVPTVCIPHHTEQFLWAERLLELGAGPPIVPRVDLSAETLAAAIDAAVTDEATRRRVAELGAQLAAEDGVGNAVRAFQDVVRTFERPPARDRAAPST
jgi:UDP:flavonoid glycosyltransferase YjiC (YdhE family)